MRTCKSCRWQILEPLTEDAAKKGEFKNRRSMCVANPPQIAVLMQVHQTAQGPMPMQAIQTVYPTVDDSTPACRMFEEDKVGEVVKLVSKK